MLIWSRWGILVLLAGGAGALSGFGLQAVFAPAAAGGPTSTIFGGIGLLFAAVYTWLLANLLIGPRLDRPRALTIWQPLPQPVVNERGARQTHQSIAVTHPETGEQLYSRPRSSFFFIPVTIWPYIFAAVGAVLVVVSVITALIRS